MVILDLSYNLGLSGLFKFKQFIKAIEDKNYALAVERLQKSPCSNQVRKRASRNMEILKLGGCEKHCKKKYTIRKGDQRGWGLSSNQSPSCRIFSTNTI
ncbi:lysozyme [Helicobacter pylori]|uniref:lysozyme n=1 Tax=Helicobacter pylori TaxID=210 RepID=UPI0015D79DCF|nr:lysozyme [Helicobacter pylori]